MTAGAHSGLTASAQDHPSAGRDAGCMATAYTGTPGPSRVQLRRADGGPVRVLVVDDEATLTELMAMALR